MICQKCKKQIPSDARYCPYCAADQQPPARKPKGRGNGQGTVVKCGKGYKAIVQVRVPERKTHTRNFRTRSAAIAALPAMRAELLGARAKKKAVSTLEMLYTAWSTSAMLKLSESKQSAYRTAYKRIMNIASAPISELVIADLQDCIEGLTYYPARDVKTVLSHLYKRACAQQDVTTNLAQYIVLPELIEEEPEPYCEAELKIMWAAWETGDAFVGQMLLMIYTAMMPGELLKCKKDMINFAAQKIEGAGLKTGTRREKPIMLPDIIMPVIRKLCDTPYKSLAGMNKDNWYAAYHATTKRIGVRDLPPYSCRHTTATALALGDTVAPALITKIMRQKRATTTERYKHADEKAVLDALNQLAVSPITSVQHPKSENS